MMHKLRHNLPYFCWTKRENVVCWQWMCRILLSPPGTCMNLYLNCNVLLDSQILNQIWIASCPIRSTVLFFPSCCLQPSWRAFLEWCLDDAHPTLVVRRDKLRKTETCRKGQHILNSLGATTWFIIRSHQTTHRIWDKRPRKANGLLNLLQAK